MKRYCLVTCVVLVYASASVSVFSPAFLTFHQSSFRQQFVKNQAPEQTTKIFFSKETYRHISWEEFEIEFEWKGKMYDVSKIIQKADGFEIICVNDSLEDNLIAMIGQWKRDNSPYGKGRLMLQPQFCNSLSATTVNVNTSSAAEFEINSGSYQSTPLDSPLRPPEHS